MKLCMGCMEEIEDQLISCPYCGFNETTLRQESYYLDPGTVIGGKYIVGRVLSYGGHTVSYLGMDAEINRKVIVREYLPSDFSTRSEGEKEITIYSGDAQTQFEQGLTNFLNEANKIRVLGSPEGIATVYDCVAENDTGYVISEYLKGRTLKEILASGKKYSVNEVVTFISKILNGLCRVHPVNIIHCDISPETIMVTDTGEIKLLDFGATRYVTTANSKSLAIILKQGYAPEEQYRSSGRRGPWTDVYALGAVMYRMITGITPQESVERALSDELKEPSKLGISIPANVENALMNALNVYQAERTPSAGVFLQELNSPSVKRIKTAKRKKETGKFQIWAKGLVAALICIVVVGGVVVWDNLKKDRNGDLKYKDVLLSSFEGKTVKDVNDWENENKKFVEKLNLRTVSIYSKDLAAGTVVEQSISAAKLSDLVNGKEVTYNSSSGKYSIEMTVYVASDKETSWKDIKDSRMNAALLMKKFGDAVKEYEEVDEERDKQGEQSSYFDILSIEYKDEKGDVRKLEKEDIDSESKEYDSIQVSDIKKISYYAGEFFCWEEDELDWFVGKPIDKIQGPAFKKDKSSMKKVPQGQKELNGSLVDDSYCTNDEESEGVIFKQTVEKGVPLDMSENSDQNKLENGVLLKVIGKVFAQNDGEGIKEFKDRLEKGLENKYFFREVQVVHKNGNKVDSFEGMELTGKTEVVGEKGEKVLYFKKEDGKEVPYFKKEDMGKLTYKIIVQDKPQTTPATNNSASESGLWENMD